MESREQLLQELRELGYDSVADKIAEGIKRWDDGLKRRNTSLREGYLRGDYELHCHVLVEFKGNHTVARQYCIRFHLAVEDVEKGDVVDVFQCPTITVGDGD